MCKSEDELNTVTSLEWKGQQCRKVSHTSITHLLVDLCMLSLSLSLFMYLSRLTVYA